MSKGHHHDPVLTMKGGPSSNSHGGASATNNTNSGASGAEELGAPSEDATGGIWNQLPHDTNNNQQASSTTTALASATSALVVGLKSVGQKRSDDSTGTATASVATGNTTLFPVVSRDFAFLLPSPSKASSGETLVSHQKDKITEGWVVNQASPAARGGGFLDPEVANVPPVPVEARPVVVATGSERGRSMLSPLVAVSPRLQSLKRMVRYASEPNLPSDKKSSPPVNNSSNQQEKGMEMSEKKALANAGQSLPMGRASEPQLPSTSPRLEGDDGTPHITIVGGVTPGAGGGGNGGPGGAGPQARLAGLLEPEKPLKPAPTWKTSAINILKYSWLNVLLVFVPVSFACANSGGVGDTVVFCVSFAAIIPLAALLGFATEELALRIGHTLGGLLNATLGNTVELIIAILALTKGELKVVQSSMIGSILSNCLLVLGSCFFAGGIRFHEQIYTIRAAQLNISLLGMSALVFVIPAAFNASVTQIGTISEQVSDRDILKISRGVAFILLFVYAAYLFFQLWTHSYLYKAQAQSHRSTLHRTRTIEDDSEPQPPMDTSVLRLPSWHSSGGSSASSSHSNRSREDTTTADLELGRSNTRTTATSSSSSSDDSDDDAEEPKLKVWAAIALICTVTVLCGLIAEYLIGSLDGIASSGNISKTFISIILLPLVGNAAEHVTAVTVSVKDKLDLSMAVAVGSSIQIALFVIPLLVLLGWAIGQPLSLEFGVLETITLFVSVVIVNQAISDGKTNYMEGLALICVYLVIGLVFFFMP